MNKMLPKGLQNIQICHRRKGKNIKEILATAKVNQEGRRDQEGEQTSCGKCVYCPLLKETEGSSFRSNNTNRTYKLRQKVNCNAMWVVYLITCKKCAAQGVGSTKTLKPRIAKYKTTITRRKTGDCGVDWHFLKDDHTWEDFEIQVIAQLEKIPRNKAQEKEAFCRLRRFEGWNE
jgi:hypothetical protein